VVEQSTLIKESLFSLEKAAEMAADEYRNDKELTAFHVLDGEDFYEAYQADDLLP
jgi:hypothetical protein